MDKGNNMKKYFFLFYFNIEEFICKLLKAHAFKKMTKRDEYGRYVWDEEEYQRRFEERMKLKEEKKAEKKEKQKEPKQGLNNLVSRTDFVDLTHGINKRRLIGEDVPLEKIGHFSCPVCQLYFRDSTRYLKHLNSPEHNKKMGMSMKVQNCTDEQVFLRIQQWEDFYTQGKEVPPIYREYREDMNEIGYSNQDKDSQES